MSVAENKNKIEILVLGAGVVGVAAAYYLARRGHQVTVIDRQEGVGLETSFANGGQISTGHEPWANPSTPLKALKWLGRDDAPLLYRLHADPALWSWSLRFLAECLPGRTRLNAARTLRLALYSRKALAELRAETAIAYDQLTGGILHVYREAREYRRALKQAELMSGAGCERLPVDAAGCVALEPALAVAPALAGGIHIPGDESGDAYKFTARLAEISAGLGVNFLHGVTVKRIHADGGRISGVETDKGMYRADIFVLALGSYGAPLIRPLGIRLPVYPVKGYSVTIPVNDRSRAPMLSITHDELKLVYSRLGDRLRAAGTAEFAGYDTSVNKTRARSILDAALELFPGCGDAAQAEFWAGLRPATPDGAPIIGPAKYPNLFFNTGHGALGWTLACGSGRVLADLVSGRRPEIDISGLGLER